MNAAPAPAETGDRLNLLGLDRKAMAAFSTSVPSSGNHSARASLISLAKESGLSSLTAQAPRVAAVPQPAAA